MKRSFLAICSAALFFAACKEVPPDINFGTGARDTTYILSSVPPGAAHNVLVEEFTGQSCSNCPAAKANLDDIASANLGRINVISLYQIGGGVVIPPPGSTYNFTDSEALSIGSSAVYNGVGQYPGAGIDRVPLAGSYLIPSSSWAQAITTELSVTDSLNLTVSSTFDTTTNVATITTGVTYTQQMSTQQNLSVVIVEDSITSFQMLASGSIDSTYLFNDVFVGMVSAIPFGDQLIDTIATKVPGRFVQSVYTYTLPVSFTKGTVYPAHCRVVAFVNAVGTGGNYQIYQSAQTPLMGQ